MSVLLLKDAFSCLNLRSGFLVCFGGGGFLTYFVWTKNDDVIKTRIGLFLAGLACLIPLINLMMGLLYTYFVFEDWLLDSPV